MGRLRSAEFEHLPRGMIFNKKSGKFYLRLPGEKDICLGAEYVYALAEYQTLTTYDVTRIGMTELIVKYINEVSKTKAKETHKDDLKAHKNLVSVFHRFNADEVTKRHVSLYMDQRKDSPTRANRERALLSRVFKYAMDCGFVDDNPVMGSKKFPEQKRDRLVADHEIEVFKEFAYDWLKHYVDLKVCCGLRQTDMLKLHGAQLAASRLNIVLQKTGVKLAIYNSPKMSKSIDRLKEISQRRSGLKDDDWFFFVNEKGRQYTPDGFRTMWNKSMDKALASGKLKERFQERDLRAKAATNCETLQQAYELLGHIHLSTTRSLYLRDFTKVDAAG